MIRFRQLALLALLTAGAVAWAAAVVDSALLTPPGLTNDAGRVSYFENFEGFDLGPLVGQGGWLGWGGNLSITYDPHLRSRAARHTSDGSGWLGFEIRSPLFTPAFGILAADLCLSADHVTYQFSTLGDVPTGNDGFHFNTSVQFRTDRTIHVLQAVGGAGVFVETGAHWTPNVPFQIAVEVLPSGVVNVYQNAVLIFQGTEISFARSGTPGRAQRFLGWTDNAFGQAGESMTIDNFTNVLAAWPALCAGDMNCDGVVDYDDIDPFVQSLAGEPVWAHWPCPWLSGDCNGDGAVTFDDIDAFVSRLGTACE